MPGLEGSASQPKVYGLRDSAMDLVQDGVNLQDRNTGAIQSRPPGLDTIQEFRVETAVSSAKLTRPASAIMITRSGTNDVHGSAVRYRPQQRLRRGAAAPGHLHQGAAPGAQRIRRIDRRPRLHSQGLQRQEPDLLLRLLGGVAAAPGQHHDLRRLDRGHAQGDFSGLIDSQNRRITLYDPWSVGAGPDYTKTPYVDNQLPMARLSRSRSTCSA